MIGSWAFSVCLMLAAGVCQQTGHEGAGINAPVQASAKGTGTKEIGKAASHDTRAESPNPEAEPIYQGRPLSAWISDLETSDLRRRKAALKAFQTLGPEAKSAVPRLIKTALSTEDMWARSFSRRALAAIGEPAVPPILELLKAGQEEDDARSIRVVGLLGHLGPKAKSAVPELIKVVRSGRHDELRRAAADALGRIGPDAKEAVPTFIELMKLSFPFEYVHRPTVARALGRIGPAAKDAVPVLLKALKDGDKELQRSAAEALKKIESETARKEGIK